VADTRAGAVLSEFARAKWLLAAFVLASLLPLVYPSLYWLTIICYLFTMGLFALSYDLVLGRTGVLSFGHAACLGLGAYAVYWVVQAGYPFWLAVVTAMLLGAMTNVAMGTALRRVKGVYFAMFTLAFAEIIYLYLEKQTSITGGTGGVFSPRPDFLQDPSVIFVFIGIIALAAVFIASFIVFSYMRKGGRVKGAVGLVLLACVVGYALYNLYSSVLSQLQVPITAFTVNAYLLSALLLFLSYYLVSRLSRSPLGAIMTAIRENDERMDMVGYDTFRYKLVIMAISGLFAGLSGAMLASLASFILTPDVMSATYTLNVLLYSILGGIGTLVGPVIGAFVVEFLHFNIGNIASFIGVPSIANWWMLIIGVFYVAVVLLLPYGIVGTAMMKGRRTLDVLRKAIGGKGNRG
jgi:branched-chain amino acid transport system permease protein